MVRKLPAGRHHLTRDEVSTDQRRRILEALAEVMSVKGYTDATVSDIIEYAKVSRPTFYEHFDSKQDCFIAGFARSHRHLIEHVLSPIATTGTPIRRFGALLTRYLAVLAADPAAARLYLGEFSAAGPAAVRRRIDLQEQFVGGVVVIFDARTKADRFACRSLVAAISVLVTEAVLEDGGDAILCLHRPILGFAKRVMPMAIADRSTSRSPKSLEAKRRR